MTHFGFRRDESESDAEVLESFRVISTAENDSSFLCVSVTSTQRQICRQPSLSTAAYLSSWSPVSLPASACCLVSLWNLTGLTATFSRSSCHETVVSNPSAHVFVSGCDFLKIFYCIWFFFFPARTEWSSTIRSWAASPGARLSSSKTPRKQRTKELPMKKQLCLLLYCRMCHFEPWN